MDEAELSSYKSNFYFDKLEQFVNKNRGMRGEQLRK